MERFGFKEFYTIYKKALIDDELTSSVEDLFEPILSYGDPLPNNPKKPNEGLNLYIDTKRASEWTGKRGVRKDVAKLPQNNEGLIRDIIDNFDDMLIPEKLLNSRLQGMTDSMLDKIQSAEMPEETRSELNVLYQENRVGEFLAKAFVWSLHIETLSKGKKKIKESASEAIDEFEAIKKRYQHKPKAKVPEVLPDEERKMDYVNQLLGAYEEASDGESFDEPDDLKDTDYEAHFKMQRKNYYQAELIHREIRDTVRKDEDQGFETLKEEIEEGIFITASKKYDLGLDKANAVLDRAADLTISRGSEDYMLKWVGPGEKMGVCHILVNEKKLKWLEDGEDEE